ncbi:MAG: hypothetical protein ACTSVI_03225 [Promethearchaeota archaeon]
MDPQQDKKFTQEDIFILDGKVVSKDEFTDSGASKIDVGGRVVIPGGVYLTFAPPIGSGVTYLDLISSGALGKAMVETGFTTVVINGFSPFSSLDMHAWMNHVPVVNKIPIIDVGNFNFLLGFLKNGITNYATEALVVLLKMFKSYSISCLNPGVTLHWKPDAPSKETFNEKIPFLGFNRAKVFQEMVDVIRSGKIPGGLLMETGVEGVEGGFEVLESFYNEMDEDTRENTFIQRRFSRLAANTSDLASISANNVQQALSLIKSKKFLSSIVDIPPLSSEKDLIYVEHSPSTLQEQSGIVTRGITEGEMFMASYKIVSEERNKMLLKEWLSGMQMMLSLQEESNDRMLFSIAPFLIKDSKAIMDIVGSLLSPAYRRAWLETISFAKGFTQDIESVLGEQSLSLENFVLASRVYPAKKLGLSGMIGGLSPGHLGDLVVLDMKPEEWEQGKSDPEFVKKIISQPFQVIKQGQVALKSGALSETLKGYTFLHEAENNASIHATVINNLEKQYLKTSSTHEETRIVPEDLVNPAYKA